MLLSEYDSVMPVTAKMNQRWFLPDWCAATFSYYGKILVTLKKTEYEWLKVYVEKIRSHLSSSPDNVFF